MKNITAILTGDWHLREDAPVCRIDDFWESQWEKVDFISNLQKQYGCPVWHSGDLFNKWNPSLYLVAETIKHLPNKFFTIYGNHDLPQHNLELVHKCGINLLREANKLTVMNGEHWGSKTPSVFNMIAEKKILLWHVMTYVGREPWPGCPDPKAITLLKKHKDFDLILTGHNHKAFVVEDNGRLLVNPGSIMRQDADQIDFKPRVYLWDAKLNEVEIVFLPIKDDAVSREHLDKKQNRDGRIEAFISRLNTDWEGGLSFEENLEMLMTKNKTKDAIKKIVYQNLE